MIDILLRVLFMVACAATGMATFIMILLSPRPRSVLEHARGLARLLIVTGALFCIAAAFNGAVPAWYVLALMSGFGFMVVLHTKEIYLRAIELEQARQEAAGVVARN